MNQPAQNAIWMRLLAAFLSACGGDSYALSVDVRSDFAPGDEFDAIELRIDSGEQRIMVDRGQAFRNGVRVYEAELSAGEHVLDASLIAAGRPLVSRRVLFRMSSDRGMTVLLTRSCASLDCGEQTCIAGACADPACTPETPEFCALAECAASSECEPGICGEAECVLGACFQYDDGSCGSAAYCVPERGCEERSLVDAGPSDAGLSDARFDALTMDSALDVGPDAGTPDSSVPDSSVPDTSPAPDAGAVGACRNPGDEAVIDSFTVEAGINLGFGCYQSVGNNATAIQSCVQASVGVSDPCAQCFVAIVQCTVANCACMNPFAAACTSCRASFCDGPFGDCSGYEI